MLLEIYYQQQDGIYYIDQKGEPEGFAYEELTDCWIAIYPAKLGRN